MEYKGSKNCYGDGGNAFNDLDCSSSYDASIASEMSQSDSQRSKTSLQGRGCLT